MIEVKGVYKQFNAQSVLNDISLTVGKGEVVGFLGRNGAGKSTMLNIITGCLAADSGTVSIGGYDVFEDPIHAKQQMGYLPENPPLYSDMKVGEYLDFVHALKGISKAKRQEDIVQAMRLADITDVENRFIRNLSKGYKQRVGLAGALCSNPQVLIFR